jgi:hypothetical protein
MMCGREHDDGHDPAEFVARLCRDHARRGRHPGSQLRLDGLAWILLDALTKVSMSMPCIRVSCAPRAQRLHHRMRRPCRAGPTQRHLDHRHRRGVCFNTAGGDRRRPPGPIRWPLSSAPLRSDWSRGGAAPIIAPPAAADTSRWPQIFPAREDFYAQADRRPADGVALRRDASRAARCLFRRFQACQGIAAYERLIDHNVTRIERSWGGLRTFAKDGNPVVGFDPEVEGLFWLAGQGGYGIQSSPALSEVAAHLLHRKGIPPDIAKHGITAEAISPARFRADD